MVTAEGDDHSTKRALAESTWLTLFCWRTGRRGHRVAGHIHLQCNSHPRASRRHLRNETIFCFKTPADLHRRSSGAY
jgi:hypothetical protein